VIQALGSSYIARHEVIETQMTAEPRPRRRWQLFRSANGEPEDETGDRAPKSP
jgi:hypothetical protein